MVAMHDEIANTRYRQIAYRQSELLTETAYLVSFKMRSACEMRDHNKATTDFEFRRRGRCVDVAKP